MSKPFLHIINLGNIGEKNNFQRVFLLAAEQDQTKLSEKELEELRESLELLRAERDVLFSRLRVVEKERDTFRQKRDELNKSTSESFGKVRDLKKKRDETNETISGLKSMRDSVLDEMRLLIEKAKALREEIPEEGRSPQGRADSRRMREEIEDYEWKIQTTAGMSVEEERMIMSEISRLSMRLGELEASEDTLAALNKINKEISNLKGYLDDSWEQLRGLVSISQERHQRLTELYGEGQKTKQEADHFHQVYIERAEEVRDLREKVGKLSPHIREKSVIVRKFQTERKQFERRVRDVEVQRVMDEKAKKLVGRMESEKQRGKRTLTFEEMKVLMSQGKVFSETEEAESE